MAVNTWDGASDTNWNDAANWNTTGVTDRVPTADDDVVIANVSNNCVIPDGLNPEVKTIELAASATLTCGNNTITVNNETSQYAFKGIGTLIPQTSTIEITTDADTLIKCENGSFNNLTINPDGGDDTITLYSAITVGGNLTITGGTLDTNSSSNYALTVAGVVTNNGTLTLNGSTVNLGSTSAQAGDFQGSGTFNFDTSTINFHTAGTANFTPDQSATADSNTSTLNLIGLDSSTRAHNFDFASGNMHNVTTSRGAGSGTHIDKLAANCTITGNLTVGANSKFSSGTRVFTVNGDVSVTGELDCDDSDKPMTFGSLTINSGGTYTATSGTTTITTATGAGPSSNRAAYCHNSGTFTHNNGLFKTTGSSADVEFTSQSETNNPFYDFEATQYAIAATTPWVVLNNMTIANGFQYNGGTGYAKVYGIMKQTGGTYNAGDVSSSTNHFFNHYELEGGTLDLSNIDITVGSIRNTGGTIT